MKLANKIRLSISAVSFIAAAAIASSLYFIAKDAIDPEDPSLLEDLITAAFRDAAQKADEGLKKVTGGLGAGLGIPGL